jgi:predicted nucleic acid-binding protein
MNVVESSGWLEFFSDGPNASFFAPPIQEPGELIVPTVGLYEVFKQVLQQRDESQAMQAVALMEQGIGVELNAALALSAAKLSVDLKLPMADSIILASARAFDAVLWTQDANFEGVEGIRFVPAR